MHHKALEYLSKHYAKSKEIYDYKIDINSELIFYCDSEFKD